MAQLAAHRSGGPGHSVSLTHLRDSSDQELTSSFPGGVTVVFIQHQPNQIRKKRKKTFFQPHPIQKKQMFAFPTDFLVSCGILIMPHALG